jgi:hypothetical protein
VSVVEVIGRTDAHIMNPSLFSETAKLFHVTVESLKLGEKSDVETETVENTHRIRRIRRRHEPVSRISYGAHMARSNIS